MLGARMKLLGESVQDAADNVTSNLEHDGGIGGVIAVDRRGNGVSLAKFLFYSDPVLVAFSLNCSGMYRGLIKADGVPLTALFSDDPLE